MDAAPHKISQSRLPFRAAAFVALVCVAILGMSAAREWSAREAALKGTEVELANLSRSLTQQADDSFDLLDASIVGAVSRLETDGTNPATLSKLQDILVARKVALKRVNGLAIVDEHGDWLASSGVMGKSLSDREYFRHHLQSTDRAVFMGHPVKSSMNDEWVVTLSRRFNHPDGSFAGIVIASIGSAYFSDFYRQFDIGESGTLSLLSTDGIIMARRPDDDTSAGRNVSDGAFFKAVRAGGLSGVHLLKSNLDGLERIGFHQQSSRYPFVILATKTQYEALAPWRHATITRMMFVLGLVLLIAVMGLYVVRQLVRGQRMTSALASKEANFRVVAEGSSDMVTRIGLDETIHYASPSSVRIVGWPPDQLVGTPALAGVNPLDLPRVQEVVAALKRGEAEETRITYRTRQRERSEIWVESTLRVTRNSGEIDGVVAITRDVTQQKTLEGKLETLATVDGLTGLANRRRFDERLLEEWGRAYRERTSLSLLMIDLDHFKAYNDQYGHPAGDECLRAVAGVLATEAKRTTDLAARYGGEEFAMLLPNTDAAGCARIGERVLREIRDLGIAHKLNFPSRIVTASIGGAVCRPGVERSAGHASLVEAADHALYAAKDHGRDQLVMAKPAARKLEVMSAAH
ncbi:diguanylate cyclase [Bradyrhizobium sp.]|uniref:diguanylate cyclase domain-containing protein n=1 Tax=Bradyrhizobium sp. TaxID=376 RepID=UPI0025C73839|nr:diguanylate cyclase [Bradyrhizobium sp.]